MNTLACVRDLWRLLMFAKLIDDRRVIDWHDANDFCERMNKIYAVVYDLPKRRPDTEN
jgi:hypothetical protein